MRNEKSFDVEKAVNNFLIAYWVLIEVIQVISSDVAL